MASVIADGVIDELQATCGEEHVFTGRSALFNRARVSAPFPVHRWDEHIPQAVVLPTSAQQVSDVVKLANANGIPVVPRAGDIKEIDLEDYTVTVGPGNNMQTLNRALAKHGVI